MTTSSLALSYSACRLSRLAARQQIAKDIRPEAVEPRPGDPPLRPAALRIGGENAGASEAVLPADQQRIAAVHVQDHLGGRLCDEPDIALERRRLSIATPSRISAFFTICARMVRSTAVEPVCSRTSRSRICSSPDGLAQKIDWPWARSATFSR